MERRLSSQRALTGGIEQSALSTQIGLPAQGTPASGPTGSAANVPAANLTVSGRRAACPG